MSCEHESKNTLGIVGHCTVCNAPIYGSQSVPDDDRPAKVKRTCSCFGTFHSDPKPKSLLDEGHKIQVQKKDIRDTMHTK